MERFLPIYARKRNFSPKTYDSYRQNLETHIYPYFGDWVMSSITSSAIDGFIDYLFQKTMSWKQSYGKCASEIPTLSSGTVKSAITFLLLALKQQNDGTISRKFPTPKVRLSTTRSAKPGLLSTSQKFSTKFRMIPFSISRYISLLFVHSERGKLLLSISTQLTLMKAACGYPRFSSVSLTSPQNSFQRKIAKVFPKQFSNAKSRLVLKTPKTEGSLRKQYLTRPLVQEIKERIAEINKAKELLGPEYQDNGFLICQPDGRPVDPNNLCKSFKEWQSTMNITDQIDLQGLRKSGQMHKIRLTKNNYQLVAANAGQSLEILMHHYNEALEAEKQQLASMVESSFYPSLEKE